MQLVFAQMLFAGAVCYSSFCRLVHTGRHTNWGLRWSIWFTGTAAAAVMLAPIFPLLHPKRAYWAAWTTPQWVWVVFLVAIVLAQLVWPVTLAYARHQWKTLRRRSETV